MHIYKKYISNIYIIYSVLGKCGVKLAHLSSFLVKNRTRMFFLSTGGCNDVVSFRTFSGSRRLSIAPSQRTTLGYSLDLPTSQDAIVANNGLGWDSLLKRNHPGGHWNPGWLG